MNPFSYHWQFVLLDDTQVKEPGAREKFLECLLEVVPETWNEYACIAVDHGHRIYVPAGSVVPMPFRNEGATVNGKLLSAEETVDRIMRNVSIKSGVAWRYKVAKLSPQQAATVAKTCWSD